MWEGKAHPPRSIGAENLPYHQDEKEQKGDLLIRNLWHKYTNSIHNISVANNATLSYQNKSPEKCLIAAEK